MKAAALKAWRAGAALAVWAGVALQFWLMVHGRSGADLAQAVLRFFCFFTILSNLAAGTVLGASALAADGPLGRWAARAGSRVAAAAYIAITAIVYHALLAGTWDPKGAQLLADTLLHSVTPALFLLDFLIVPPRETARWGSAWKALVFPAAFGAWSLLHGALSGFYPYPFLDVASRGYGAVLTTMALMGLGFYAVTLALTGLQHLQLKLALRARRAISA
ncbi:Pr6Pr family membrane protein [Caulobacter sp. LARHSG274]